MLIARNRCFLMVSVKIGSESIIRGFWTSFHNYLKDSRCFTSEGTPGDSLFPTVNPDPPLLPFLLPPLLLSLPPISPPHLSHVLDFSFILSTSLPPSLHQFSHTNPQHPWLFPSLPTPTSHSLSHSSQAPLSLAAPHHPSPHSTTNPVPLPHSSTNPVPLSTTAPGDVRGQIRVVWGPWGRRLLHQDPGRQRGGRRGLGVSGHRLRLHRPRRPHIQDSRARLQRSALSLTRSRPRGVGGEGSPPLEVTTLEGHIFQMSWPQESQITWS